ncbi:Replication initiation and membrane attachment [Streptococcus gordonii]|uniref:DnaD domain-containing protein n=1 Tax=Streptococcus gordonii TaxID=1302 RepID=UPI00077945D0|nr:DnaD domain protein [Streptococcus gordonii]QBX25284.1 DNA replication protein [Streptococcus phage Javan246]RSJ59331.1 Replication initiation and membrane attachment [Streptococcus gordonii]
MAQRRMISKEIIQSQRFLTLPLEAQALYFHLIAASDDDGVVDAFPIVRMVGAREDNLGLLVVKKFVLPLNNEMIYFITDFSKQNKIRQDRIQPSIYRDLLLEKTDLVRDGKRLVDKNEIFDGQMPDKCLTNDRQMADVCQTSDGQMSAQYSIGKYSIGEYSLEQLSTEKESVVDDKKPKQKSLSQIIKESNIKLNDRQAQMLLDYVGLDNMTIEMIQYAVELTEDAGANNFNYLNKILKSWREKKLTTLDAVKKDVEEFEIRKSNPSVFKPYRDELPF